MIGQEREFRFWLVACGNLGLELYLELELEVELELRHGFQTGSGVGDLYLERNMTNNFFLIIGDSKAALWLELSVCGLCTLPSLIIYRTMDSTYSLYFGALVYEEFAQLAIPRNEQ